MKARLAGNVAITRIFKKASSLSRSLGRKSAKRSVSQRAGFTIIELLVVIIVIAILATVTIVSYSGIQKRAQDAVTATNESQAKKALEVYNVENGQYPSSQSGFDALIGQKSGDKPYITYTTSPPYKTYALSTSVGGSVALACATNFIPVPGNSSLGTSDFCVMKYEAKFDGSTPVSRAAGTPATSMTQTEGQLSP